MVVFIPAATADGETRNLSAFSQDLVEEILQWGEQPTRESSNHLISAVVVVVVMFVVFVYH